MIASLCIHNPITCVDVSIEKTMLQIITNREWPERIYWNHIPCAPIQHFWVLLVQQLCFCGVVFNSSSSIFWKVWLNNSCLATIVNAIIRASKFVVFSDPPISSLLILVLAIDHGMSLSDCFFNIGQNYLIKIVDFTLVRSMSIRLCVS